MSHGFKMHGNSFQSNHVSQLEDCLIFALEIIIKVLLTFKPANALPCRKNPFAQVFAKVIAFSASFNALK